MARPSPSMNYCEKSSRKKRLLRPSLQPATPVAHPNGCDMPVTVRAKVLFSQHRNTGGYLVCQERFLSVGSVELLENRCATAC